jgi:hypothetical protein
MTPTSTASTKAERNRHKKEYAKKRQAEEMQKVCAEAGLLEQMSTVALEEKALDNSRRGDFSAQLNSTSNGVSSNDSSTEQEPDKRQVAIPSNEFTIYSRTCVHFLHLQVLTFSILLEMSFGLFEIKQSLGKGLGVFATQKIEKYTLIFQEAPLLRGGSNWLEKEAAFMLLSEDEKEIHYGFSQPMQLPPISMH